MAFRSRWWCWKRRTRAWLTCSQTVWLKCRQGTSICNWLCMMVVLFFMHACMHARHKDMHACVRQDRDALLKAFVAVTKADCEMNLYLVRAKWWPQILDIQLGLTMHIVLNNFSIEYIWRSLRAWKAPETAEEKEKKAKERAEKLKAKKDKKPKREHDDVKSEDDSEDDEKPKFLDIQFALCMWVCHAKLHGWNIQNFEIPWCNLRKKKKEKKWSACKTCGTHDARMACI